MKFVRIVNTNQSNTLMRITNMIYYTSYYNITPYTVHDIANFVESSVFRSYRDSTVVDLYTKHIGEL